MPLSKMQLMQNSAGDSQLTGLCITNMGHTLAQLSPAFFAPVSWLPIFLETGVKGAVLSPLDSTTPFTAQCPLYMSVYSPTFKAVPWCLQFPFKSQPAFTLQCSPLFHHSTPLQYSSLCINVMGTAL